MLTDQLQDSPREQSAPAKELKRMKFSEGLEEFNNIFAPEPTADHGSDRSRQVSGSHSEATRVTFLKVVLPSIVPQNERADPDPTPVGRPPPPSAPPPSTIPSQSREQRAPGID